MVKSKDQDNGISSSMSLFRILGSRNLFMIAVYSSKREVGKQWHIYYYM